MPRLISVALANAAELERRMPEALARRLIVDVRRVGKGRAEHLGSCEKGQRLLSPERSKCALERFDIAHLVGLGWFDLAAHLRTLYAHGAPTPVNVAPAQRDELTRAKAGKEGELEIVDDARRVALRHARENCVHFVDRERVCRFSLRL